jgi:hypothetical protein
LSDDASKSERSWMNVCMYSKGLLAGIYTKGLLAVVIMGVETLVVL